MGQAVLLSELLGLSHIVDLLSSVKRKGSSYNSLRLMVRQIELTLQLGSGVLFANVGGKFHFLSLTFNAVHSFKIVGKGLSRRVDNRGGHGADFLLLVLVKIRMGAGVLVHQRKLILVGSL